MNRIDRILQAAALPDVPVEALPEDRQAGILNGTMQLVQQNAKKHGRKRVIRIMIAAAAAIAVLCGAAAVLHYASVSNAETTYHAEGASIRPDGTLEPFSYDFPETRSSASTRKAARPAPTAGCNSAGCQRR